MSYEIRAELLAKEYNLTLDKTLPDKLQLLSALKQARDIAYQQFLFSTNSDTYEIAKHENTLRRIVFDLEEQIKGLGE